MALTNATELANYAAGIGTQGATLKIDTNNKRVGVGTTNPQGPEGSLQVGTGITFFGNTGIISAIGGKFSGDFTVGGTLTYEDVQNVNSTGIVTARSGINIVGGGLTVTGVSTFFSAVSIGDTISLGDHDRLRFGTGNDLQIYHDGSHSYIKNATGNLYLQHGAENMAQFTSDGNVELYHNNVKKFETTSAGAKVSGSFPDFIIHDTDTTNDNFRILHNGGGTQLLVDPNDVGPNASYLIVGIDGTERLRVDSSGRLLLNTNSARTNYFNSTSYGPLLNLEGTGNSNRVLSFIHNDSSGAPLLVLGATGGSSAGSNTIIGSSGKFGFLSFQGADGSQLVEGAKITGEVDGTPGADDMPGRLVFSTTADGAASPTERLRIDSLGNIGVNQTSVNSSRKMEITQPSSYTSGLRINSAGSAGNGAYFEVFVGSANYKFGGDHNTNALLFKKDGTEYMRHDSSGRLLIGHTSSVNISGVESHLQVAGTNTEASSISVERFANDASEPFFIFAKSRNGSKGGNTVVQDDDTLGRITFQGADGSDYEEAAFIKGEVDGTPADDTTDMPGRLVFGTTADGDHNPTERLRIASNGNIGIGSQSPGSKLTVYESGGNAKLQLQRSNTASNTDDYGSILWRSAGGTAVGSINVARQSAENDGYMFFQTASAGTLAEKMRLKDDGALHIGNTTTSAHTNRLLAVGDVSRSATYIECRTSTSGDGGYLFSDGIGGTDEGYRGSMEYSHSNNSLFFKTSGTTRLTLSSSGIILSPPTYNNTTSNAANMSVPNSDGQFYRSTSSIKYKDNVTTLPDNLADKILECRPVSFTSKCENDNKTKINYGLIAEEVNAIDPSLVFLDNGEPEGVQYDRFVPHLINLVKRLEKRLTDAGL